MDITEKQLEMGQVKTIYSNGGETLDYVELLFSSHTKAAFGIDKETNKLNFIVKDTNLKLNDLSCKIDKNTLRDLIIGLKDIYNTIDSNEV